MSEIQQRLAHVTALLNEAQQEIVNLSTILVNTGADAQANRMTMQAQTPSIASTAANAMGTCVLAVNTMTYQVTKQMLKGFLFIGDGSDEPYALPVAIWESRPGSKSQFSGRVDKSTNNNDKAGGIWLYTNDDGTISFSASIELEHPIAGQYRGTLSPGTPQDDFEYKGHGSKEGSVPQLPSLARLTNNQATAAVNQQMMPASTPSSPAQMLQQPAANVPQITPTQPLLGTVADPQQQLAQLQQQQASALQPQTVVNQLPMPAQQQPAATERPNLQPLLRRLS